MYVTSDLASREKEADHGQGGGGTERAPNKRRNFFFFKILTSNPYALNILQTLFAKPAPVKAFGGTRGGGYPLEPLTFPKRTTRQQPSYSPTIQFFFVTHPQDISKTHA